MTRLINSRTQKPKYAPFMGGPLGDAGFELEYHGGEPPSNVSVRLRRSVDVTVYDEEDEDEKEQSFSEALQDVSFEYAWSGSTGAYVAAARVQRQAAEVEVDSILTHERE